jgi:hypothetical protein
MQLHSKWLNGRTNAHHSCKVSFKKLVHSNFRWRPLNAPGVTKNVIIATNADGSLYHFHTTSGKQLNKIKEEHKQLLTCDYK